MGGLGRVLGVSFGFPGSQFFFLFSFGCILFASVFSFF